MSSETALLAAGADYIETKSKVWMAIASQNGLATALRRSAKARPQPSAAAAA